MRRYFEVFGKSAILCIVLDVAPVADGRLTERLAIGSLTRLLSRDLVDEVLVETRRMERRSRLLPARVVVYYVLALCLFFGESYEEVMRQLVGGLRFLNGWADDWKVPTSGAISQARARLGEAPLRRLFERVAVPLARRGTIGGWYHGWRVMAIDGVVLDVPDTPENSAAFGRTRKTSSSTTFPQVRMVGLAECGTHAVVGAQIGSRSASERALAPGLLPDVKPDMIVLADRGFYSFDLWRNFAETGADLLWRVTGSLTLPVLEALPDGSYRSHLLGRDVRREVNRRRRHVDASFPEPDDGTPVRVVEYMIEDRGHSSETFCLITTILDHELAPAHELAELYHQRWEIEITLDEIETHQIGSPCLLRSRTPELVRQEVWALLLTHYAIRSLMQEAADAVALDPDRLSFLRTLRLIRRQVADQAGFSPSPTRQINNSGNL
jgi:hypothetical protein